MSAAAFARQTAHFLPDEFVRSFSPQTLDDRNRPLRLKLAARHGLLAQVLMLQRIDIQEQLCGGITAHLTCLSTRADLPLSLFKGLPLEIQIVTDDGQLRRLRMIVQRVQAGQADGALATC